MKKSLFSLLVLITFAGTANAQATSATLTATPSVVAGAAGAGSKTIKVDGGLALPSGWSFTEIRLEIGTLNNGVFTSANPKVEKVLGLADLTMGNYSYTFPGGYAVGTYAVKATAKGYKPGTILGPSSWNTEVTPNPTVQVK